MIFLYKVNYKLIVKMMIFFFKTNYYSESWRDKCWKDGSVVSEDDRCREEQKTVDPKNKPATTRLQKYRVS